MKNLKSLKSEMRSFGFSYGGYSDDHVTFFKTTILDCETCWICFKFTEIKYLTRKKLVSLIMNKSFNIGKNYALRKR